MTDRVRQNHPRGVLYKVAVQSVRSTQPTAIHCHIVVLVVVTVAAANRLSPTLRRLVVCHNLDRRSQCIIVPQPHPRGRPRLRRSTGNLTLHDSRRQFPDSLLCVTEDLVNGFALRYTPCTLIMESLFFSLSHSTHAFIATCSSLLPPHFTLDTLQHYPPQLYAPIARTEVLSHAFFLYSFFAISTLSHVIASRSMVFFPPKLPSLLSRYGYLLLAGGWLDKGHCHYNHISLRPIPRMV